MSEEKQIIQNNSEILFIYDAKMCNPNGDPDNENKPRMDYNSNKNLVSDVRLKRYIRDYLMNHKKDKGEIFVAEVEGKTVDATKRLKSLIEKNRAEIEKDDKMKKDLFKDKKPNEKKLSEHLNWLLSKLVDVRFFGATMPIKNETGSGSSITFTGPIQFNWGYSLNKVTGPMDSNTITSTFAGATADQSTMGKDYRVDYSIIAFHGIISAMRAKSTNLTDDDIKLFDSAMEKAIPLEATTRSKIGQEPLLYIRVEYNTNDFFYGDFRKYIKLIYDEKFRDSARLRSTEDYKLDLSKLSEKLIKCKDKIKQIYFWKHDDLELVGWNFDENRIKPLPKKCE